LQSIKKDETVTMKNSLISTHELGGLLGVTRQTIRNWIRKGDIKAYQIGQNLKIPIEEATRLLSYYGLPFPDWLHHNTTATTDLPAGNTSQALAANREKAVSPISTPPTADAQKAPSFWTLEAGNDR
jgi:excisionase family DNA binding protein